MPASSSPSRPRALRKALDISLRYSDAVCHLAYILYSRHDFAGAAREARKAIELYERAIAITPQPDYATALGDTYAKSGRPTEAGKQYDLVEYIAYPNSLNKVLYNRELATFYADHDIKLTEALDLARKELEYRRDTYAYDLLAWALHKNGKNPEALAAITEALKLGTKDARLFFHAGMIYHRVGETEKARAEVAAQTLRELEGQPGPPGRHGQRHGQ